MSEYRDAYCEVCGWKDGFLPSCFQNGRAIGYCDSCDGERDFNERTAFQQRDRLCAELAAAKERERVLREALEDCKRFLQSGIPFPLRNRQYSADKHAAIEKAQQALAATEPKGAK